MNERMRWTFIDSIKLRSRPHLNPEDQCFYYLQRDGRGYAEGPHAAANSLIMNFKKGPEKIRSDSRQAYYRNKAIRELSTYVIRFFEDLDLNGALCGCEVHLVPVPTSKPRDDPDHDNRMDELCSIVSGKLPGVRFTPLLDTVHDLGTAHGGKVARDPGSLAGNISCGALPPSESSAIIALIDDVLTTGSHFAACRRLIFKRYPSVPVIGLFLSMHVNE